MLGGARVIAILFGVGFVGSDWGFSVRTQSLAALCQADNDSIGCARRSQDKRVPAEANGRKALPRAGGVSAVAQSPV